MTDRITTAQHPTSGETFAVRMVDGIIKHAAGPLHHDDPTDEESLAAWLANADLEDTLHDGGWLQGEIDKSTGDA